MSINIMDLVKGAVSDQVLGQMGGLLGGKDASKTKSLFEMASGAILGGMMKKASTPQGAQEVFKSASSSDGGVLDKLGDILGGGSVNDDYQQQGSGILDMVFGQDKGGIFETLAKSLGLDKGMIGKLLAMAAPIVMGVIGKHLKAKALDAVGLGKILGEQKSHLSSFMPAGLMSNMGMGDVMGAASGAVGAASDAGRAAVGNAMGAANDAASAGGSLLKTLIPIIIVGALAFAAYKFWPVAGDEKPVDDQKPKLNMVDPLKDTNTGGFKIKEMTEQIASIVNGFTGLNEDNAQGLADKITGLTNDLDTMGFEKIPEETMETVSMRINGFRGSLLDSVSDFKDQAGIYDLIRPLIDTLLEKFKTLGF